MVAGIALRKVARAFASLALIGLMAVAACAQLMPRTQPPAAEELPNFERALQSWLTSELSLQNVEVAATRENISVGFELVSEDRDEIVSQITLVALQVAPAAPWAQHLRISPAIAGHPAGVVTIAVDAVRRLANGQVDEEGFFRTWQTDLMPVMADYPADLLAPLASQQGWSLSAPIATDGLSALVEFGLPEAFERFPENHPAALATVRTGGGELKVAIIEAGDAVTAEALLGAISTALGGTAPPQAGAVLNVPRTPPIKVRRDGGLLYIAAGAESDALAAISTLADPPAAPTMVAEAGGTATGATTAGDTATSPATGQPETTTAIGTADGQAGAGHQLLFADSFDGPLDAWDTSVVSAEVVDGAMHFTAQQRQSLILRHVLPMDNIAIEFRARADTNGLLVYLMRTQDEHYGWALGMGGNQHSLLVHDASGQALETVIGPAYVPGQWHTWRLTRQGATLQAWRDGQPVISSQAAASHAGEGLLVFSTDNARISLDDLRIYDLSAPSEPAVAVADPLQPTEPLITVPDPQTAETAQPIEPVPAPEPMQPTEPTQPTEPVQPTEPEEPAGSPYEPMPLVEESVVKQAIICLGFDDRSNLIGVQDVFPSGTEKVALYMEIEGARPNSEIQMTWQRDGNIIGRQLLIVSGDRKNLAYLYAAGQEHLWDGHYAVDIRENGELVGRVTFRVGDQ